jgi:hypothetical protein
MQWLLDAVLLTNWTATFSVSFDQKTYDGFGRKAGGEKEKGRASTQ